MDGKGIFQSIRDLQQRLGDSVAGRAWDAVHDAVAHAITDVRQKVIEEPWFGRAVTPELVKQVEQSTIHSAPGGAGIHGPAETPAGSVHGAAPAPEPRPSAPTAPERPGAYREAVEALYASENRPGRSFAEAVAERYGWANDFWPMRKDAAEAGRDLEHDHGVER